MSNLNLLESPPTPAGVCSMPWLCRVLVACEFSGIVRDAFAAAGCHAVSCDLLPSEAPGHHLQCDVREVLAHGWDLMICHPPCTHLAVSGARWFTGKKAEQAAALEFVQQLLDAPIPHIALENPVSIISSRIRRPDQIVQPYQFGHGETKATCLWLKNLPRLQPTDCVEGRANRVHREPPGPERWKNRSRTFRGIAAAMAGQWTLHVARHNSGTQRPGTQDAPIANRGAMPGFAGVTWLDDDLCKQTSQLTNTGANGYTLRLQDTTSITMSVMR